MHSVQVAEVDEAIQLVTQRRGRASLPATRQRLSDALVDDAPRAGDTLAERSAG